MERKIITDAHTLKHFCSKLAPEFSLDTETTSLDWYTQELVGFSLCDGRQACYISLPHAFNDQRRKELVEVLDFYVGEAECVIMHNAPFDMAMLYKHGIRFDNIFDTMTAWHLIDENLPSKSLKYLARTILNVPPEKIKEYDKVDDTNLAKFSEYALNDAIWTYQLYKRALVEIDQQNLGRLVWDIEMPFQHVLTQLRINGAAVDRQLAKEELVRVRHLYYQLEDEMYKELGNTKSNWYFTITPRSRKVVLNQHINFNSSDQMIPIIESLGIKITETTKKGNKSVGKAFKERIVGTHPFLDKWIKYGKCAKLLSSFLEPFEKFIDGDERIRSDFHNAVTSSGRLSCSDPNVEQLPQNNDVCNIRNLYVASPGNTLIVADYSSQELRILAEETNDAALKKAFREGQDLHAITAESCGVSRTGAKRINFGISYGKSPFGFAQDFRCSIKEAEEFLEKFFTKYPSVLTRMDSVKVKLNKDGWVCNISGRRRRFPDYNKKSKWQKMRCFRQAFNFLIQSFAADMVKIAASRVITNPVLRVVNLVHDEIVTECPVNYVDQGVAWVKECMENAVKLSLDIPADICVVDRYGSVEK